MKHVTCFKTLPITLYRHRMASLLPSIYSPATAPTNVLPPVRTASEAPTTEATASSTTKSRHRPRVAMTVASRDKRKLTSPVGDETGTQRQIIKKGENFVKRLSKHHRNTESERYETNVGKIFHHGIELRISNTLSQSSIKVPTVTSRFTD